MHCSSWSSQYCDRGKSYKSFSELLHKLKSSKVWKCQFLMVVVYHCQWLPALRPCPGQPCLQLTCSTMVPPPTPVPTPPWCVHWLGLQCQFQFRFKFNLAISSKFSNVCVWFGCLENLINCYLCWNKEIVLRLASVAAALKVGLLSLVSRHVTFSLSIFLLQVFWMQVL